LAYDKGGIETTGRAD